MGTFEIREFFLREEKTTIVLSICKKKGAGPLKPLLRSAERTISSFECRGIVFFSACFLRRNLFSDLFSSGARRGYSRVTYVYTPHKILGQRRREVQQIGQMTVFEIDHESESVDGLPVH